MSEDALEGEYLQNKTVDDIADDDVTPSNVLKYSQKLRRVFVESLTEKGVPTAEDDRKIFLMALRDMDSTAIAEVKNDIEREGVENDRAAQEIVRKLSEIRPFGLAVSENEGVERNVIPDDISKIESITVKESELKIGLNMETSAEFLRRMGAGDKED